MNTDAPRILIVRLSAIGDVIHALPCLDVLRRHWPKAHIGWVVEELSRDLVEGHPQLDEVFVIPKKRWRSNRLRYLFPEIIPFYKRIRASHFDIAIDFQGLTKSGWLARVSGAPIRVGHSGADCREINGWFTNQKAATADDNAHIIDRNLNLLSPLGIDNLRYDRILPDHDEWNQTIDRWYKNEGLARNTRFVALNPGAGWITKRWPIERFAELGARIVKELRRNVLITWGPGEEGVAERVMDLMAGRGAESRLAPRTTIGESIALMKHIDAFIGGDTGPTHLAAAANVPVVAIYGGSDADRNHPAGKRQTVLWKPGDCAPCWRRTQTTDCDLSCLKDISASEVFDAAKALLDNGRSSSDTGHQRRPKPFRPKAKFRTRKP